MSNEAPPSDLMEALIRDPVKRGLILQLLNQEKDGFEAYKRREIDDMTPEKLTNRLHCESPTALQRRRALEMLNRDTTSGSSSSEVSEVATEARGPKVPFEELLKGVKAFVEVKRNNLDKSEGIKAVMRLMGASIRDRFTNDVTHVVFKDGSFTTYQKAKLMNVHLVSVLWLDAVKKNHGRVPEKKFPAFGTKVNDNNVSVLCSQLQKEYEEIIKDEKRRSVSILSSTSKADHARRRTVALQTASSKSSMFAEEDREIQSIVSQDKSKSPEVTSDDSDCGVVDGETSTRSRTSDLLKSDSISLLSRNVTRRNNRQTIRVVSDMSITPNLETSDSRRDKKVLKDSTSQSVDSDLTKSGLQNISSASKRSIGNSNSKNKENSVTTVGTTMSSLRLSDSFENKNDKDKKKSVDAEISELRRSRRSSISSSKSEPQRDVTPSDSRTRAARSVSILRSVFKTKKKSELEEDGQTAKSTKKHLRTAAVNTMNNITPSASESERGSSKNSTESKDNSMSPQGKKHGRSSFVESEEGLDKSKSPEKRRSESKSSSNRKSNAKTRNIKTTCPESERGTDKKRRGRSNISELEDESLSNPATPQKKKSKQKRRSLNESENDSFETPRKRRSGSKSSNKGPKRLSSSRSDSEGTKKTAENTFTKKTRKLYNPDDIPILTSPYDENKEREDYLKHKTQKSPNGVFLNPNHVAVSLVPSRDSSRQASEESDWLNEELNRNTKKSKKNKTPPKRDSNGDEQRELLDLLTKTNDDDIRRSSRISLSQIKTKYCFSSCSSWTSNQSATPNKRRSTLDFQPLSQTQQKRRLKLDPKRKSSIVCTKMHREEVVNFENIVRDLGVYFVEDNVTDRTTHLVAAEAKRTINILRALSRGCWILSHDWLLKSKEEGRWVAEEDYELTEFSPAVQECRLQRQAFGPSFTIDVFKGVGFIYIGRNTSPKTSELKELIVKCKGRVTGVFRNASVIVGEFIRDDDVYCVTEKWVLDSITFNTLKPFRNYLIKSIMKSPEV